MKSQSGEKQQIISSYQGGLLITWNHVQKTREGMMGTETYWECDEVFLHGIPTKKSIREAIVAELTKMHNEDVMAQLAAFGQQQKAEYDANVAAWKVSNPYPQSDSLEQTAEQRAWWLMLVNYQDILRAEQDAAYEAKAQELSTPVDFTTEANNVATEVINQLNQE